MPEQVPHQPPYYIVSCGVCRLSMHGGVAVWHCWQARGGRRVARCVLHRDRSVLLLPGNQGLEFITQDNFFPGGELAPKLLCGSL